MIDAGFGAVAGPSHPIAGGLNDDNLDALKILAGKGNGGDLFGGQCELGAVLVDSKRDVHSAHPISVPATRASPVAFTVTVTLVVVRAVSVMVTLLSATTAE